MLLQRICLTLRYDGTRYHGWQVQKNAVTVQALLQDAIEAVTGVRSDVTGCSRTDAGVHARMFCCAFETESALRGEKLAAALNAHLPSDVAVYACRETENSFHPRYDAKGKRYIYRIWNGSVRNPFEAAYAWHRNRPLQEELLDKAARLFVGTHDFAAFQAAGSSVKDTVRTVYECRVERHGDMVEFVVVANGFLYNMVRIMVGTLMAVADGKLQAEDIRAILVSGKREQAGPTAPPHGLFLDRVYYSEEEML